MSSDKARVLIVDDEIHIREILADTLGQAGYECVTVGSADEALAQFKSQKYELVLSDIRMPGMSGIELLRLIKIDYPETVVIMITGLDSTETAIAAIKLGAYDYIVKPFNLEQILVSANRAAERSRLERFTQEYQKYLEQTVDARASDIRHLADALTRALVRLLEIKVPFYQGHSLRVAEMTRQVAQEFKLTGDGVEKIYRAALLHDIGALAAPESLLHKQAPLTDEERRQIRKNAARAEEALREVLEDEEIIKFIRHLHERIDGGGYPDGLKGNLIPLGARIIAVAEAFDAMTQGRPYREALSPEAAIAELKHCADLQFDPEVVKVFSQLYDRILRSLYHIPADKS